MKNKLKPVFFTSDWHLGHDNCISFDQRPFKNVKEMAEVLIKKFNSTVPENGVTYFLGDMGNKTSDIKPVIEKLNGTKIMIMGNHDKGVNRMYDCGFSAVLYSGSFFVGKEKVTMSHCPLPEIFREDTIGMKNFKNEPWHGASKKIHQMSTVPNEGQFHLSGHIHSRKSKSSSTKILHRQIDVGVTAWNYRPVSFSEIVSWITKTLKNEKMWKPIPEFPEYSVNYYGQVKSFKLYSEGRLLKPHYDKDGYLCLKLRKNNKAVGMKVHRAVALAFLENPDNLPQVNHKNCLKFDNTLTNLEWCSNTENQRHAWMRDRKTLKLKVEQVSEIKTKIRQGISNKELAKQFSVDPSIISCIKHNKIWKDVK